MYKLSSDYCKYEFRRNGTEVGICKIETQIKSNTSHPADEDVIMTPPDDDIKESKGDENMEESKDVNNAKDQFTNVLNKRSRLV